jgi:hypothetical protein
MKRGLEPARSYNPLRGCPLRRTWIRETRPRRICQACGAMIPAGAEVCPVCALRGALDKARETVELSVSPAPSLSALRFDHYEILIQEDGTPLELGRGAMGVTYKGFDTGLRMPVTLKVISEKYVGDESARLRFLREARAAAKVRHGNVASVLHLGRTGNAYFYLLTNSLMQLSVGSEIQIHGSERHGRRARDSRSSSRIAERC